MYELRYELSVAHQSAIRREAAAGRLARLAQAQRPARPGRALAALVAIKERLRVARPDARDGQAEHAPVR